MHYPMKKGHDRRQIQYQLNSPDHRKGKAAARVLSSQSHIIPIVGSEGQRARSAVLRIVSQNISLARRGRAVNDATYQLM
jgi:hypothetical protein